MHDITAVQEWLNSFEGQVLVQRMKNGDWLFSIQRDDETTAAIRPTFREAVIEVMASNKPKPTRKLVVSR